MFEKEEEFKNLLEEKINKFFEDNANIRQSEFEYNFSIFRDCKFVQTITVKISVFK